MPFPELPQRVADVRARVAEAVARGGHAQSVRLIAVSKTHGPDAITTAAAAGITDVGENKVQEALRKQDALREAGELPTDVRWHLIGHLQTNKAKALDRFALFHALDRAKLSDAVHTVGEQLGTPVEVLVQVNVSGEGSKGGFSLEALPAEADRLLTMTGLHVAGVMTMAPFDAAEGELRRVFSGARAALDVLRAAGHGAARELSMGMSGDYELAVEEGATMIRLGTVLFGTRG